MVKRLFFILLFAGLVISLGVGLSYRAFAQEEKGTNSQIIKGTVKEIADDEGYIIVNDGSKDVKIYTTADVMEETYLEAGDEAEITAEETDKGLMAISCSYIFEEEESTSSEGEMPESGPFSEGEE